MKPIEASLATLGVETQPPRPRITPRGLALTALGYLFLGGYYAVTVAWGLPQLDASEVAWRAVIDYSLKAVLTIPVWWIVFRTLDGRPWSVRLLAHGILAPLFTATWFYSYYWLLGAFDFYTLSGPSRKWDIYIPSLFYILQFSVFHGVQYARTLRFKERLESEIAGLALRGQLASLESQLQPHFLFNTLNSISASVPKELETTREMIARLAALLRYSLEAGDHDRVKVSREVAFVRDYLELERARFGDRLRVRFAVDSAAEELEVPPMLLQPLVENAVKHGVGPQVEGADVEISIERQDTVLKVSVADSGPADAAAVERAWTTGGVGLRNTDARLRRIYGDAAGLSLQALEPMGFRVEFRVPLERV